MQQQPLILLAPPEQPRRQEPQQRVPVRVEVALRFVHAMTEKTSPLCAVNPMTVDWRDGQSLTTAEANALASACNMLNDYFKGKLPLCNRERMDRSERNKKSKSQPSKGLLTSCPNCQGKTGYSCKMCRGAGAIRILPEK